MKRFEELISYENLYRAHRVARLGKRHKREVIDFEMHLSQNLWAMHYDLLYDRYRVGGYHCFMIHDPKEREIQAIGYRDRILQHVLCDGYLTPVLEKKLIYYNVACRKGKGTSLAVKALRRFMTEHYKKHGKGGYFIKADIHKYFSEIDHGILKKKLSRIVQDERVRRLLFDIIDSYHADIGKGLPLGNQSSQSFALLYLDALDKYVTCTMGVRHYVRYMDDIIVLVDTKAAARRVLSAMADLTAEVGLSLNPKSQIAAFSGGVSFLGWHFFCDENGALVQTVKKKSKGYMWKHFRHTLLCGRTDIAQTLVSYRGYLLQGDGYRMWRNMYAYGGVTTAE